MWGVPCSAISSEWGAQRIKGLSISKVLWHACKSVFKAHRGIDQKNIETSLIEKFLYPKFGPGQMWEAVADEVLAGGGDLHFNSKGENLNIEDNKFIGVASI